MISIGTVWDRTTDVLAGRAGILATIAVALFILPSVAQSALDALLPAQGSAQHLGGILSIVAGILTVWGTLAATAVASDPAVTRDRAFAIGAARLPAGIGAFAVVLLAAVLVALPGIALLASAGFDWARAQQNLDQPQLDVARAGWALLYFLAYLIVWLWISARLVPLLPIVVNERLGLGAFRRSLALTRGSALKLIGVILLYAIVLSVVVLAASSIVGLVFRLILGPDALATVAFVAGLAVAVITALFSVVQSVFSAQFYLAARDARDGIAKSA